ncbi:MAG: glycosyltransferase [Acidobacteria bacterium]|nr:glycosyltransferase [Acidobacteriota bacterium]
MTLTSDSHPVRGMHEAREHSSRPVPDLSLIVACFNEMRVIEASIRRLREVLGFYHGSYELILIDDGSRDGTPDMIRRLTEGHPRERLVIHPQNMGRGATVAHGLRLAAGRIAGYIDIDLEIDAFYLLPLVMAVENGADIATARRWYPWSLRSLHRQILSKGYSRLVRWWLKVPLADTETGCKMFSRQRVLPVLDQVRDAHWFWDTEIMVRAHRGGLRILEIPALYQRDHASGTTVRMWSDTVYYLRRLWQFRKDIRTVGPVQDREERP